MYSTSTSLLTDELPVSADDVEWVVASLLIGVAVLEEEAVGTQLGLGHAASALVVQVALVQRGEEAVLLGALEV